jgi:hypothetical protein
MKLRIFHPPGRRLVAAGGLVAAMAMVPLVAGCASDEEEPTLPGLPDDTPTQSQPGQPTEGAGNGGANEDGAARPTNAEDYARAAFEAWREGDMQTLSDLVSDQALAVLATLTPSTSNWVMTGCDAGAGSVSCTFESENGEVVRIRIDNQKASDGEGEAVVEAQVS